MLCWLHLLQSILLEALFVEDLLGFSKLFSFEMLKFASKQLMESARLPPLLSKERKKKLQLDVVLLLSSKSSSQQCMTLLCSACH